MSSEGLATPQLGFVFSGGVNAWSIAYACTEFGVRVYQAGGVVGDAGLHRWTDDLPEGAVLFFTEEDSLLRYLDSGGRYRFPRPGIPPHLIDDKLAFAQHLTEMGEAPVPYTVTLDETEEYPCLLKCRHSWVEGQKLPRGFVCVSHAALQARVEGLAQQGLRAEWFFVQKLIRGPVRNCFSVCGFFDSTDPSRELVLVTHKIAGTHRTVSSGVIVATVTDPASLVERTRRILRSMDFVGPFEMEFLFDRASGMYYVLELNPRFWLQHGLFIVCAKNGLVRRYLGLDQTGQREEEPVHGLWVSLTDVPIAAMRDPIGLMRGLVRVVSSTMARRPVLVVPHPLAAARFLLAKTLRLPLLVIRKASRAVPLRTGDASP